MKRVRTALIVGALIVIAAAAIAGHRKSAAVAGSETMLVRPAVRMPAAVVLATPPTISELLDIVLGDRGPASNATPAGAANPGAGIAAAGSEEARIATVLLRYTSDRRRADRIATALVREGRRRHIGSQLLVGVLLVENPWLNPRATSFAGARGLMQVMPFHAGNWGCPSPDLFDIESNVCHGVAVLAENIRRAKTLSEALLGYNGCVRGTNTPDCWRYPSQVFRLARIGAAAAGTPAVLMPFPFGSSGPPRRSVRRPPAARHGNILLPRELLVE